MVEYSMGDLVCLHLQNVGELGDEPVPRAASRPGIADALALDSQAIAARVGLLSTLSELTEEELIEKRSLQIEENGTEEPVYSLTTVGEHHAEQRREELQDTELLVRTPNGEQQLPIPAIEKHLPGELSDPLVEALARAEEGVLVVEPEDSAAEEQAFINRESELETLQTNFERAVSGTPQTVFVSGEPGVGKTTLVRQLEPVVDRHDGHFLYGRCHDDVSDPYQPFLTAVADLPGTVQTRIESLLTDTDALETEDHEKLEAQRSATFYEVGSTLTAAARETPIVLFLDDTQWIDVSTALLFANLSRRVETGQLMFVSACRPESASGDWPLDDVLEELDDASYTWVDVDRFDRDNTAALVRATLGTLAVPDTFIDQLYERTDGNPLFVRESVQRMRETNAIDPEVGVYPTSKDELTICGEVEETIVSRFESLDEAAQTLLELGAIIGDTIPLAVLQAASDLDHTTFREYIRLLQETDVWQWEDAQGRLYFKSGVVRESLQANLDESRRRRFHERVADAYRVIDDIGYASAIAHHERQAGNPERALASFREAGDDAMTVFAHEVAIESYEQAAEIARELDDDDVLLDVVESMGDTYRVLDEYENAHRRYEFVRERTASPAIEKRMYRKQAALQLANGAYDSAAMFASAGLDINADAPLEDARFHATRGSINAKQGEPEQARLEYDKAQEVLQSIEDTAEESVAVRTQILNGIGNVHRAKGEITKATPYFEDAVALQEEQGDKVELANALLNYGSALSRSNEYEEAVQIQERARDLYEEIGDRHGITSALNNLGITYQYLDAHERALECYEEGLEIARVTDNKQALALLTVNLGYVSTALATYDDALEYASQARELGEEMGDPTTIVCTHEIESDVYFQRGEIQQALDVATEGLRIAREADARNRIAGTLSLIGEMYLAQNAYDAAIDAFQEGIDVSDSFGNTQKAAVNQGGLVRALTQAGRLDEAVEHVERLESLESMGENTVVPLAMYHRQIGEPDTARDHLERGFELVEQSTNPPFACEVSLEAARLEAEIGAVETAYDQARQAQSIAEENGLLRLETEAQSLLDSFAS